MPNQPKKFSSVRATRLSLLMALSLTVGIGTTIYAPLAHSRAVKANVQQPAQVADAVLAPPIGQLPEPLLAPGARTAAPLVPSIGSAAEPQRGGQASTGAGSVSVQDQSVSPESAPAAPERPRPAQEERSEDREGDAQTGRAPAVRLVEVTQRTPGYAGSAMKRSVTPPLARQVTPSPVVTGHLPSRLTARPAAPVARQAVPRIVRRPAAPVIATTSAS